MLSLMIVASDNAIAGWAKSLHSVYTTVGGYLVSLGLFHVFYAHVPYFSLDRFRQSLKTIDYWKLLCI
jgi:hypothetical protein